ncbi:hypothetical protein [Rufibacter latericius]|uniref:Uncharacterized protein n=1 Tax=Rufibacter latericius TaxID=2487040 RepID=A0A3M9MYA4_9BACT|nr:hypothetical protein [Rufibacter latericius]RNI30504.1 hypothetical protein EFB08_04395 [Rufibacter latericius]
MKTQGESLEELQQLLFKLELLTFDGTETTTLLLEYLHQTLDVFRFMFRDGYTEQQPSHVINYCIMKLEFAKKQIENEDVQEGLEFTKSVIVYFLKETSLLEVSEEPDLF